MAGLAVVDTETVAERRAVRLLQMASVVSAFDRFAVGTLLVTLSSDLQVSLGAASAVASWYFICYGTSQPAWGLASDRFGRVRTLRLALALAVVGAAASACAPNLAVLVPVRAVTGAVMAAVVPTALIYLGDTVPLDRRQRVLTDLSAASAIGITVATMTAGLLASAASWRLAFALPGLPAAVLVVALRRLPEPAGGDVPRAGLRAVARSRWAVALLLLALVEGAALLGFLTYLAPALEDTGYRPAVAGVVVGSYGIGLLLASRVVKRLASRVRPAALLAGGSAGLATAYSAVAVSRSAWVVGAAAILVGSAWAMMHTTMQTWATEVVPGARAAMVSLFAAMLFIGSGAATAAVAPLAAGAQWLLLFGVGSLLAALFGFGAAGTRSRYDTASARGRP